MPSEYSFDLTRGKLFNTRIVSTNSDGSYFNFNGYSISGLAKWRYGQTGYVFDLNPTIHSSLVSGIVDIVITGNVTANIPAGKYMYDINIYNISGAQPLLNGYINMYPSVG